MASGAESYRKMNLEQLAPLIEDAAAHKKYAKLGALVAVYEDKAAAAGISAALNGNDLFDRVLQVFRTAFTPAARIYPLVNVMDVYGDNHSGPGLFSAKAAALALETARQEHAAASPVDTKYRSYINAALWSEANDVAALKEALEGVDRLRAAGVQTTGFRELLDFKRKEKFLRARLNPGSGSSPAGGGNLAP